ncbi:GNAT family N-acetyltransferase [uncultured Sphingomonas sp.]|uniref:GNAT family N-acetyltransferase n=1 Tax=uncultured Sphingomonas sp. TaxID=158754 RepID=UPI0025D88B3A|nr:GNAT family N-acetyltransferase [uncultured Sphingomonas sp.]
MLIRAATTADRAAIAGIIMPIIRAGETYALDRDMDEEPALAFWFAPGNAVFVAEVEGQVLGSYFCRANKAGGGAHVANCGYATHPQATGRGIARAMALHSFDHARAAGFRAMQYNFVVATNDRAVRLWLSLGFEQVGRLPQAFDHPASGEVDALVLYRRL